MPTPGRRPGRNPVPARRLSPEGMGLLAAQEALHASEERYRDLLDHTPGLMFSHTLDGRLLTINPAAARALGYTPEELADQNLGTLTPTDRQVQWRHYLDRVQEQGEARLTLHLTARDGGVHLWMAHAVRRDDRHGPPSVQGYALDVTDQVSAQDALRATEERYRLALSQAADPIWIFEADGACFYANDAAGTLLDRPREASIGRTLREMVAADDADLVANAYRDLHEHGRTSILLRLLHADGRGIPVQVHAVDLADGTIQAIGRDMSAWLAAQKALHESEERYRRIVETAAEGIWVLDAADRTVFTNQRLTDLLGAGPESLLGQPPEAFVLPEAAATLRQLLHRLRHGSQDRADLPLRQADGATAHTMISATPYFDQAGAYGGALLMVTDISARQRAERQVRASEERYRSVAETPTRGLFLADHLGAIRFHNQLLPQLLGAEDPLVGQSLLDLTDAEHRLTLLRASERAREGAAAMAEVRLTTPHRGPRLLELALNWLPASGQMLGEVQDITDQRALEEHVRQAQRMDSVGNLAAGISHDFNNLLTVIQANLSEALRTADALTAPALRAAEGAARSAAELSQRLLAIGRAPRAPRRPVNVAALAEDVMQLLRRTMPPQVQFQVEAPSALYVHAAPEQLHQVLMNLAINSCDAMPDGGQLTIRARALDAAAPPLDLPPLEHGYVLLEVEDSGVGMDEATAAHVFDPFFTTKEGTGTGLGCAVVYGIVREHGGAVTVVTAPGKGATFRLYLPAATPGEIQESPPADPPTATRTARARILVVDDLQPLRRVCAAILASAGYTVEEADSGEAAVQRVRAGGPPVDVMVLDSSMPGLSGRQTFDAIVPLLPSIRVLFVSGYAADTLNGLRESPRWRFLQKPFDGPTLLAAVEAVLTAD